MAAKNLNFINFTTNSTHNCPTNDSLCLLSNYFDATTAIFIGVPLTVLLLAAVFVNILAILGFAFARKVPLITKILIGHLSFSCLILAATVMPLAIGSDALSGHWVLGQEFCRGYEMLNSTLIAAILYGLAVVAIDQRSALDRLITHGKRKHAWASLKKCITIWVIAVLVGVSAMLNWRLWYQVDVADFRCRFKDEAGFVLFQIVVAYLIPLIILFAFNYSYKNKSEDEAKIIRQKYRNAKEIDVEVCSGLHMKLSDTDAVSFQDVPGNAANQSNAFKYDVDDDLLGSIDLIKKQKLLWSKLKVENQVSQAVYVAAITCAISFLPNFILILTETICPACIPHFINRICLWFGYSTTISIPIVFIARMPKLRRALSKLCPACCCLKEQSSSADRNSQIPIKIFRFVRNHFSSSNSTNINQATTPSLSNGVKPRVITNKQTPTIRIEDVEETAAARSPHHCQEGDAAFAESLLEDIGDHINVVKSPSIGSSLSSLSTPSSTSAV